MRRDIENYLLLANPNFSSCTVQLYKSSSTERCIGFYCWTFPLCSVQHVDTKPCHADLITHERMSLNFIADQSMPAANKLQSTCVCIMTLIWLVEMASGEPENNINIDQCALITSRIYSDKLLMKCELMVEAIDRVPGELFAVFMNLHLPALKLIQLLPNGSLGGAEHTHTQTHKHTHTHTHTDTQRIISGVSKNGWGTKTMHIIVLNVLNISWLYWFRA